jgi:DNA-binding LacI/PurR family transcriptional regulator
MSTTTARESRPTIRDIASVCGVSEATVSYVINGKRQLKPATRERVFRTMREMNYHPNAVARGLASKRVHTLGILSGAVDSADFITNAYAGGLLKGIMICAQREDFNVTIFTASWQNAAISAPPLRDGRTDGVLTIAPPTNSDILPGLISLQMPIVAISAGRTDLPISNVDVDDFAGAKMATDHLLQLGHRRIAYLTGNDDLASYGPRRAGFCAAMDEAGVPVASELIQASHFNGALAFEQTVRLLRQDNPPTAIFAGNDSIAFGVIDAARCIGISVPTQLSVIGFDDSPQAVTTSLNLTTVRQPLQQIGETAAALLIRYMREPDEFVPETQLLAPELIVRGTTASPA